MQPINIPIIAVIGSDGSGKSTVCEHLINCVQKYGPAVRIHLGKQAGNVERAVVKLPLMGKALNKTIKHNKVKSAKKLPGPVPALVIMSFVLRRLLRFRRMLACHRRGLIVLADRYPQIQIPGAYDGTVFPANVTGSRFVLWLAGIERSSFSWMANHKPDLVIKLNVDLDVACARKPDHRREALAKKIAITPQLTFDGSQLVDIDANKPLNEVLIDAEKAITSFMETRGYRCIENS
ncbi:ATP-binding protein [Hafnia paralvei]|uniref:ATP-binding protein n=1 Tax=Hafnia paralvei TaxID=546367 RepID=A0A2A2MAW1_9GAMM|nr:ATP-binding protein [Hafnia paralvei]KHS44614.1 ATP-binding protein [Hafnia paralvei]MBU2672921.1 thymidylate kinase [Hafnia paralvei]PAV95396.1 ATP-binding protein [Hafnia paralvei]TBL56832.1 thymidylate kinase [Hafnia paralvei]